MKIYAKIDGDDNVLEFPVYASHIKLALPNIAFPAGDIDDDDLLAGKGYVNVAKVDKPAAAKTVVYISAPPEIVATVWTQKWVSITKTAAMKTHEKSRLKTHCAVKRAEVEAEGITHNTMTIHSGSGSQSKLHAVRTKADQSIADDTTYPWTTVNWQGQDGTWYSLAAADVVELSDALYDHVEKTFNACKIVEGQIDDEDHLTETEVQDAFDTEFALL